MLLQRTEHCEGIIKSASKLIMVDEFQDTDLLQVAIIDKLSRDHGANVMTVGDAQQTLYRFRGADVEVFFDHRSSQEQAHENLQALSLPDNFEAMAMCSLSWKPSSHALNSSGIAFLRFKRMVQ